MKSKKRAPLDFGAPAPAASDEEMPGVDLAVAEDDDVDLGPEPKLTPMFGAEAGKPPARRTNKTPAETSSETLSLAAVGRISNPAAKPIYLAAGVVSILWALAPIAYAVGYRQGIAPLQNDGFALAVFALLALGPVALVWIAAYVLNQGLKLAGEARRTRVLAEQMLAPAALAATDAHDAVAAVRAEIDHAAGVATQARDKMLALREALSVESERLAEATAESVRTAAQLTKDLVVERSAMSDLATSLDGQSTAITDAISRQAKMVAEASDLAETQLREAEAALAARAADMAAAAGEASDAARVGAEDLARQIARLETAGLGESDQIRVVDEGLGEQRAALIAVAHALRAGQEDFAVQAESQVAQLTEFLGHAKLSAIDVGEMARSSAEAITELTSVTGGQLRELAEAAREEREAIGEQVAQGFARIGDIAAEQRQVLEAELLQALNALTTAGENAHASVESQVQAAQARVDNLGEAAFTAGQRADAAFEARLGDARQLIESSAQMVEQAAAGAAQKLEQGVDAARAAVGELERLLSAVTQQMADAPVEVQSKAAEVQAAVGRGVDELLASARRAADETQAIDAAFQERVRRNYDMLSEATRMMSAVAGSPLGASTFGARPARAAEAPPPAVAEAPTEGPRLRLRLQPTATDAEFSAVFDAAGGKSAAPTPPEGEGDSRDWRWKDLLTNLDDTSEPGDERLAERLASEIGAMGIDPGALLPKGRIDEIVGAVQDGDAARARMAVKGCAPAAVRRLVRRLFSDASMREDAERFRARYGGMIAEAAQQDRSGNLARALLASEAGRSYLLLDTAAGDLA
ncbi:MAG: polar localization protein TipN [Caulobacterales bacterium]|nr:polar localization protein TipN [Caulobacterales bacterium]